MDKKGARQPGIILKRAFPVAQYAGILLIALNLGRLPETISFRYGLHGPRQLLMIWVALLLFLARTADRRAERQQKTDLMHKDSRETGLLAFLAWAVPGLFLLDALAIAHLYDCWLRNGGTLESLGGWQSSSAWMAAGCVLWIYGQKLPYLSFQSLWGIRTSSTLASESAWKNAHARFRPLFLLAGTAFIALGMFTG